MDISDVAVQFCGQAIATERIGQRPASNCGPPSDQAECIHKSGYARTHLNAEDMKQQPANDSNDADSLGQLSGPLPQSSKLKDQIAISLSERNRRSITSITNAAIQLWVTGKI